MPRTQDLVIFVPMTTTTTTTDRQTDCFTPCACTRGNYFFSLHSIRINTVASRGLFIINVFAVGCLVPRKEVLHNPHSLVPSPIPVFSMLHAEKIGIGLDIRIHIQNCCWVWLCILTWREAPLVCATKRNVLQMIFFFSGSKSWKMSYFVPRMASGISIGSRSSLSYKEGWKTYQVYQ